MLKKAHANLLIWTAVASCLLCHGCRREQGTALSVVGSTSIQPFAEMLAEQYMKANPGHFVEVQGGGSTAGLQAVGNGLAEIGMCSRMLKPEENERFTPIVIARDGLAVVVNPDNPVVALTTEQLRGLFTGKITNWHELGGSDARVWPITREEGSGTRESFVDLVMAKQRISRSALNQESNGAVKELVHGDQSAIGYMSLGLVGDELKAVTIDGATPTSQNVLKGTYRLARPFLFVTKGTPSAEAQKFINFVLSPDGQRLLEAEGLVRVK